MKSIAEALADLDEAAVLDLTNQGLAAGSDPHEVLSSCREGMRIVGERFEAGEYFISDLMMSGAIFKKVVALLDPFLVGRETTSKGAVVVGTVAGDIHDIGKDLVVSTLRAAGYAVTDLGVDVPAERFVDALRATGAPVLGLSGLLTISFDPMRETVEAVVAAGLRDAVKIMVGGGPVTEAVRVLAGADALGADPPAAVRLVEGWMEVSA